MKSLQDILPVWSVEHDAILNKMGDITIGYRIELPEMFSLGEQQLESFHQAWVKAIRLLPAGTILHKQDWFTEARYKADFSKISDFLEQSSEQYFSERPFLDHDCYLFLTRKPKGRGVSTSALSTLLRKHLVPADVQDGKILPEVAGIAEQFIQVLEETGCVKATRMDTTALHRMVNRYLALNDDGIIRDIQFNHGLQVGEQHCELFSLGEYADLPNQCSSSSTHSQYSTDRHSFPVGFVTALGPFLSCNHIYNQYVLIEDAAATLKQLESKKLRLQSLSKYERGNAAARDAVNDYLNDAVGGGRLPVRAHFNILTWTDDRDDLPFIRKLCANAITKIDAHPRIETTGAPQIYWAGIPGNAADLPVNDTFLTFPEVASCFIALETSYRSSVSPIGVRLGDRLTGKPLHVDISDEPMQTGLTTNRNKIVVGPSGSGKSFFTNHLLHGYHAGGSHIVVVDMGNSYAGLCQMLGGYYFTYTEEKPIAFNPFHVPGMPDTEKKESIKTLLVALWKKDDESFIRSEYVALSSALQLYYEREVGFRGFNSFYEFLRDEFTLVLQQQQVKDKDFDVSNFLYVLRPYYKGGEFDYLLNASKNLDVLQQRFIVFEIDTIKDHPILFPVVTIIIMELFIAKMRCLPGVRKIILIEEAWKAIAKAGMADYVKYLFKTVRKYFGEAIVVTQDLDDILSSEIIRQTIVNNADVKILLDQSKYQQRFQEVQQMLGLPDSEVPKILSMNKANDPSRKYKEVYIWPMAKVYRVEVSPEEYLCYTTEEKEKVRVREAAVKHGSLENGIRSLVLLLLLMFSVSGYGQSIDPVSLIISKVVKAVDLKIQKLQMEQLWLQYAQKLIENKLHELKLEEITKWSEKQKELYRQYYDELKNVRETIMTSKQLSELKKQNVRYE